MPNWNEQAEQIMAERFGKDAIIALATTENGIPHARFVDAYYEGGCFYTVTHALSGKMKQIEREPVVAIAGEWFTAHGRGASLGFIGDPENAWIARKLRAAFAAWIDNGHSDLNDRNTVILRVALTDAVLLAQGVRYELTDHNGEGES